MTQHTDTHEHRTRRLVIPLPGRYDKVREQYERVVPAVDTLAFTGARCWRETVRTAQANAPYGFMRYFRGDVSAALAGSPSVGHATQYLMGNHVIAETMFRHDPSVMLHAPLRTLLFQDCCGATRLAVDQPSLQFASYGHPEITAVGEHLDALLGRLITVLGGRVPEQLQAAFLDAFGLPRATPTDTRDHRASPARSGVEGERSTAIAPAAWIGQVS
ncbi:protein of uncharacterised function DUF302 [Mycobacteroides abscessus subsp. abscessus]|nr:DUF302 domain-containing protein [Mycobacteroides abscessus]SIK59050.1 protein of uncharacterised function DUF302 [Mycobacteroides abscessus subsp. abscessus]